ncbi:MAG: NAD(P)H-hydrate epimerase [Phycisphaerales bacterium]|jgi:hydroxyethylthiazole kinase-like uncharacterized protein yjeF
MCAAKPGRPRREEPAPPPASEHAEEVPILDRAAARALDEAMAARLEVPSILLMEHASLGLAGEILDRIESGEFPRPTASRPCLVLCGPGNNGGDGWAAARHLALEGVPVRIAELAPPKDGGDADRMRRMALRFAEVGVPIELASGDPDVWPRQPSIVVDALFGTGLDRPLAGETLAWVEAINRFEAPIVAADLPSGLDADTGAMLGAAVRATLTVTFAAAKPAMRSLAAQPFLGEIVVVSIGEPDALLAAFAHGKDRRGADEPRAATRPPRTGRKPREGDV